MILRRKLILVLGPLIGLLLIASLASILLLHNLLATLEDVSATALAGTTSVSRLGMTITEIETALGDLRVGGDSPADGDLRDGGDFRSEVLFESTARLEEEVASLGDLYQRFDEGCAPYERICELLPVFVGEIEELATLESGLTDAGILRAFKTSSLLRKEVLELGSITLQHLRDEQAESTTSFRWMVLGIGVIFVLVLNVAILVLLRAATIVLGPINRLVEASRHLANEEFSHRVEIAQNDEFDELATAYNEMAAQLQSHDERRLEVLHQVARTLRHNLNNAIEVIDLQLRLINRSSSSDRARMAKPLEEIHSTLIRMSKTVGSLSQVKQIVLTDYLEGVKMLDLEESVKPLEEDDPIPTVQTSIPPPVRAPKRISPE